MRSKKIRTAVLMAATVAGILAMPAARLDARAATGFVSIDNQASGISSVMFHTPEDSVRLYAGMTWEELDMKLKLRLNVRDSDCGPLARKALSDWASYLKVDEVKLLDMDLEKYIDKSGWALDIERTNAPIRVCIALPADSDPAKDYAVISLGAEGAVEVLGDLDLDPKTITVDSDYFDTFMIVAGQPGAFDAYRVASQTAPEALEIPVYVRKIDSTITILNTHPIGVLTDEASVKAAAGGKTVSLEIGRVTPGPDAMYVLDRAVKSLKAENKRKAASKEDGSDEVVPSYYEMDMRTGGGDRVTNTNGKLRITIGVPYSFPAYADYAAAVLNMDGSVTIMKDIDENACTITVDTDQFRTYLFLWGRKGAFD